jgi:hypothetical protein
MPIITVAIRIRLAEAITGGRSKYIKSREKGFFNLIVEKKIS